MSHVNQKANLGTNEHNDTRQLHLCGLRGHKGDKFLTKAMTKKRKNGILTSRYTKNCPRLGSYNEM